MNIYSLYYDDVSTELKEELEQLLHGDLLEELYQLYELLEGLEND